MGKKWYNGNAPVMASDEPETSGTDVFMIFIAILVISGLIATPICLYVIPRKSTKPVNETVIHDIRVVHDTLLVRDTIRIEQTPVTFICHGICNGIEDFSRD